ncbi:MAG TPA: hypothetical protein VEB59_14760 [Gemmatimonadales bacterium]|nr:hypothetical protein [Gemmatimonadales bacterium]
MTASVPGALIALLVSGAACAEGGGDPAQAERSPPPPTEERYALGAAFVGGNPRGLAEVLHPELVVQPPSPDSALQGAAAAYLTDLAAHSRLAASELSPQAFSPEGTFLLEQGTWIVRSGDRVLGSRYHLRWRRVGEGWKVVLLRWSRFR